MVSDSQKLSRTAQPLVVEYKQGFGTPPAYPAYWTPLFGAAVERIIINHGTTPNSAIIRFNDLYWQQARSVRWGDMIRIRTDQPARGDGTPSPGQARTVVFIGFVTAWQSSYCGGDEKRQAWEKNSFVCGDFRWLISATSPVYGQCARSPDDYWNFGYSNQTTKPTATFMSGLRCIFNPDGRPNKDRTDATATINNIEFDYPVFANPDRRATGAVAEYWTCRQMVRYLLGPNFNAAFAYLPITNPAILPGMEHKDWDRVINSVNVDGLDVISAIGLICKHIGWSLREEYFDSWSAPVGLVFYKPGAAAGYIRDANNRTILHRPHAPAVGDYINPAVAAGVKLLWSMDIDEDITGVVNNPWGLGAPDKFEATFNLVPGWQDSDLVPDSASSYANLFKTEAEIQAEANPNQWSFFNKYHARGAAFLRDVGRKWVLNESGKYSATAYDRGVPFDFAAVLPPQYILYNGKRIYAPFNRSFLNCLTFDKDSLNSVGLRVEFSFDSGATWQIISAMIENLPGECGIRITEPNLCEMLDIAKGSIASGPLAGKELDYWTSLADDKVNSRVFKDGQWKTRVRVTATVQMDQRLRRQSPPADGCGSPFYQRRILDFSDKYGIQQRTTASVFTASGLPAWNTDYTLQLEAHVDALRKANQDMSINGRFTFERLWLGDGSGCPDFACGDCIECITGRDYSLAATIDKNKVVFPEIIQITFFPEAQKMNLVTRDLRLAEFVQWSGDK